MFSSNLKYLREKFNMEQIDLAKALGRKSSSSISEWESGKYTPKLGVLNEIAKIFKVNLDDLMSTDLSSKKEEKILTIYDKLNDSRKENVLNYALFQLSEQEQAQNVVSMKKPSESKIENWAAHAKDEQRVYSDEELENARNYLDGIISKQKNTDF